MGVTTVFTEAEVEAALGPGDLTEVIDLVEQAYRHKAAGAATLHPRQTIAYPPDSGYYSDSAMRLLPGILPAVGSAAIRVYPVSHAHPVADTGPRVLDYTMGQELLLYYRYDDGMALAGIIADRLIMNLRTAGPTGVATRHMARPDSRSLGVVGAGRHAPWQIRAVCAVRPIDSVRIYSPTASRRERLAAELAQELDIDVRAVESARDAVTGADVVVTVTNANRPVIDVDWLAAGAHVNVIARGEVDAGTVLRADTIACSWREQIVDDVPEFRPVGELVRAGRIERDRFRDLDELIDGGDRRADGALTLFLSQGVGIWDAAVAPWAYRRLVEAGKGTPLALS